MESLMALLAAYDVLTDKTTFYEQGLQGIIVEHEAQLRSDIRKRIVDMSSAEAWLDTRVEAELGALDATMGEDLGLLHAKYIECRGT